jgi:hypothetical protein
MNTLMQRVCAVLVASAAITACSDSEPLGSIQCVGDRIRCGLTEKQEQERQNGQPGSSITLPSDRVSSTGLEVLMSTLTADPFSEIENADIGLTTDEDGNIWSISSRRTQVVLTKLDREGVVVEEHVVDPPKGTRKPQTYSPNVGNVVGPATGAKATVGVFWSRGCDGSESDPNDCQFYELLVFDDFAKAPRRIDLEVNPYEGQILANASGEWLLYGDPRIDKVDVRGNLVWRQTGLFAHGPSRTSWHVRGALRADNELSVVVGFSDGNTFTTPELWQLDSRGNIESLRTIPWAGRFPHYVIDSRGRHVIVAVNTEGDIGLMRVLSNGTAEGNIISREEYQGLDPNSFAIDPDDAAYITTMAGGRELDQTREVLCQLPATGAVRCFTLGDIDLTQWMLLPNGLVAPEPGVVYVRSGSTLRRYELPAQ